MKLFCREPSPDYKSSRGLKGGKAEAGRRSKGFASSLCRLLKEGGLFADGGLSADDEVFADAGNNNLLLEEYWKYQYR